MDNQNVLWRNEHREHFSHCFGTAVVNHHVETFFIGKLIVHVRYDVVLRR